MSTVAYPLNDLGLTERQNEIYAYILRESDARRPTPTVRQIGVKFGIRSPNGVMCHLKALERKGWITRSDTRMSRSIEIARRPGQESRDVLLGRAMKHFPAAAYAQLRKLSASTLASIAAELDD
jgi:repressor LexA